jgi:hypothetical protein
VVDLAWVTARRQTTTMTLPWRSQASPWPSQRDDAPRPLTRLPAPRSCGPLRRPGVLLPVGGCAPAPRHARARGCGPWQPRHRPARRLPGGRPHGRMGSDGAGPGQRRAGPGLGSAIAQAAREPDLALAGRWGSAPRAGSGGSSRLTRRRPGRPSPRSASAGARGGDRPGADRQPVRRCASAKFVTARVRLRPCPPHGLRRPSGSTERSPAPIPLVAAAPWSCDASLNSRRARTRCGPPEARGGVYGEVSLRHCRLATV